MRICVRYLPVLLALTVAARAASTEDLLDPHPTARDGISFNLPKAWKERPQETGVPLLVASPASADTDTTGDYLPVIIIRATPHAGTAGPINGDAQQAHVASEIKNYDVTEKPQQISVNGLDTVTFGGTFTQGALKLRSRQYFILANDHLYALTIITLASTWDQRLPALEASVHSFTISAKK